MSNGEVSAREGAGLVPVVRDLVEFLAARQFVSPEEATRAWRACATLPTTAEEAIRGILDAGAITLTQGDMVRRTFVEEQRSRLVRVLDAAVPRGLLAPGEVGPIAHEFDAHALADTPESFLVTRGVLTAAQVDLLGGRPTRMPRIATPSAAGAQVDSPPRQAPPAGAQGKWGSHVPVLRAVRPFRRRAAVWLESTRKGGLRGEDLEARRRAVEAELAGEPSLVADLVGAIISLLALAAMAWSTGSEGPKVSMAALVVLSATWLLPGHLWIFAIARAIAAIVATALFLVSHPSSLSALFDPIGLDFGRPPTAALPLPIGQPLVALGICLVAVGVRSLTRYARDLSVPAIAVTLVSLVGTTVVCALGYAREVDARMSLHERFATEIVNTRNSPDEDLSIVRASIEAGRPQMDADERLRRLELAFPGSRAIGVLRASFDEVEAAETRRLDDERRRQQAQDAARERAQQAQADREDAIYTRCFLACLAPLNDCIHGTSYSEQFCRANFKDSVACDDQCGGNPMLRRPR